MRIIITMLLLCLCTIGNPSVSIPEPESEPVTHHNVLMLIDDIMNAQAAEVEQSMIEYMDSRAALDDDLVRLDNRLNRIDAVNAELYTVSRLMKPEPPRKKQAPASNIQVRKKDRKAVSL